MNQPRRRSAFTLVEVLLVVVIMAVLAGAVVSQFSNSSDDAKLSVLQHNLNALRSQLQLYQVNHSGVYPAITGGALPQLTSATNSAGTVGTPGTSFPYGPYIVNGMPANPITGTRTVTASSTNPPTAASGTGGWLYHAATGGIWADSTGFLQY